MSEMVERVANVAANYLYELGPGGAPEGYPWKAHELRRLDVDGVADCVALAELVIRAVLVAQAEWARTASPSDVGDPDFFEEGLRGFARAHGIEMGKADE